MLFHSVRCNWQYRIRKDLDDYCTEIGGCNLVNITDVFPQISAFFFFFETPRFTEVSDFNIILFRKFTFTVSKHSPLSLIGINESNRYFYTMDLNNINSTWCYTSFTVPETILIIKANKVHYFLTIFW